MMAHSERSQVRADFEGVQPQEGSTPPARSTNSLENQVACVSSASGEVGNDPHDDRQDSIVGRPPDSCGAPLSGFIIN